MDKKSVNFKKLYYGFPVILISYYDENGVPNITTLSSSFTLANMICLGIGNNSYALNQIKKVKDFVVNIPDRTLMKEMDICGYLSGNKSRKFELTDLTPVQSSIIKAPMIKECPISIECSLTNVTELEDFRGITTIFAAIKGRCVSTDLLDDEEHLIYSLLDPVLYVGDTANKTYRYTEKYKSDNSGSFI